MNFTFRSPCGSLVCLFFRGHRFGRLDFSFKAYSFLLPFFVLDPCCLVLSESLKKFVNQIEIPGVQHFAFGAARVDSLFKLI